MNRQAIQKSREAQVLRWGLRCDSIKSRRRNLLLYFYIRPYLGLLRCARNDETGAFWYKRQIAIRATDHHFTSDFTPCRRSVRRAFSTSGHAS